MLLASLYYLVRPRQQRRRDLEAEGRSRLNIDDELECRSLLDREIGGPGTSQQSVDVVRRAFMNGAEVRTIAQQAADLDVLTKSAGRRQTVSERELGDLR